MRENERLHQETMSITGKERAKVLRSKVYGKGRKRQRYFTGTGLYNYPTANAMILRSFYACNGLMYACLVLSRVPGPPTGVTRLPRVSGKANKNFAGGDLVGICPLPESPKNRSEWLS